MEIQEIEADAKDAGRGDDGGLAEESLIDPHLSPRRRAPTPTASTSFLSLPTKVKDTLAMVAVIKVLHKDCNWLLQHFDMQGGACQ